MSPRASLILLCMFFILFQTAENAKDAEKISFPASFASFNNQYSTHFLYPQRSRLLPNGEPQEVHPCRGTKVGGAEADGLVSCIADAICHHAHEFALHIKGLHPHILCFGQAEMHLCAAI